MVQLAFQRRGNKVLQNTDKSSDCTVKFKETRRVVKCGLMPANLNINNKTRKHISLNCSEQDVIELLSGF